MAYEDYTWAGSPLPSFYPAEHQDRAGRYYVELSVTCYPYKRGHDFSLGAYPEALKGLGANENTNFYMLARDEQGEPLEDLAFDVAVEVADDLNERYHDLLLDVEDTWEWERWPLPMDRDDLYYWK